MSVKVEITIISHSGLLLSLLFKKKIPSSMIIILCLSMIFSFATIKASPLARRTQRQTITGELASGLTNTGTSFNSWGTGYNSANYDGYQQQQQHQDQQQTTWWNQNDIVIPTSQKRYGKNQYYEPQYNKPITVDSNWKGFGMGKNPYGKKQPQYGVKY